MHSVLLEFRMDTSSEEAMTRAALLFRMNSLLKARFSWQLSPCTRCGTGSTLAGETRRGKPSVHDVERSDSARRAPFGIQRFKLTPRRNVSAVESTLADDEETRCARRDELRDLLLLLFCKVLPDRYSAVSLKNVMHFTLFSRVPAFV